MYIVCRIYPIKLCIGGSQVQKLFD